MITKGADIGRNHRWVKATPWRRTAAPRLLQLDLLRDAERIVNLDPEIVNGAL
jgi:hypothetical protein